MGVDSVCALAAALLLTAACSGASGADGGTGGGTATGGGSAAGGGNVGGGGASSGGGSGGGGAQDALTGHSVLFYRLEASQLAIPDPAISTYTLMTPLADGGFATQNLSDLGDGGFAAAAVPAGELYLHLGTQFIVTRKRSLDLDNYDLLGRPGLEAPPAQVPVRLTLTGLQAYNFSELDWTTPNVGLWAFSTFDVEPSGSSVTAATGLLTPFGPLPDGTAGDHTWLNEVEECDALADGGTLTLPDGGQYGFCNAFGPGAQLAGLALRVDGGAVITATLAAGASVPLSVTFSPASFLAHHGDVYPGATDLGAELSVYPSPGAPGLTPVWAGYSGVLFDLAIGPLVADQPLSFGYVDPFPSDWVRIISWGYSWETPTLLPHTNLGRTDGSISEQRPLGSQPALLTARLSPPNSFTIDGHPAAAASMLSRLTPFLVWSAPVVGTVSLYDGVVYALTVDGTTTVKTFVTEFTTPATHFQFPDGVLESGNDYVVRLSAIYVPGLDYESTPIGWASATDSSTAQTVSGIWHAP